MNTRRIDKCAGCALLALAGAWVAMAADTDEFKVKREEVYEFTRKPEVERIGEMYEIRFAVKAYCDVTVAVENEHGKILCHIASGVLGPRAPIQFQKNSLTQKVAWDGKDDYGRYVESLDGCRIRVSLGLKPSFEKNLFWSPHKRIANACPLLAATEDGVYVFEGRGLDQLKLYDRKGDYVRTVYPFPANKLDKVVGLEMREFPQDGKKLPAMHGCVQASMLTSGTSSVRALKYKFGDGYAATAMAASKGRLALVYDFINRLGTDGTTGGLPLKGAKVGQRAKWSGYGGEGGGEEVVGPASAAFSPDGKTLYLSGYMWREFYMGGGNCLHGVLRVDFESDAEPQIFAGAMKTDEAMGSESGKFCVPVGVACDAQGRVYVADHMNDRVQVFSPDGKHLKNISVEKPSWIQINQNTGEIWVFSWAVLGIPNEVLKKANFKWDKIKPTLARFKSFDAPELIAKGEVPLALDNNGFFLSGPVMNVVVDWYAPSPTLWVYGRKNNISRIDVAWGGSGAYDKRIQDPWSQDQLRIFEEKDGKWQVKRDFAQDVKNQVNHLPPADFSRQRLVFNPQNEKLYEIEDSGFSKSFYQMREIDPETGEVKIVQLPFDTEDICFDQEGMAYLRTDTLVVRYNSETWKEVPWDYGEEQRKVGFTTMGGSKRVEKVLSGLATPGQRPVCWHLGGMWISPKGHLAVACCSRYETPNRKEVADNPWSRTLVGLAAKPYSPKLYPGRARWQEIHVWDRRGKIVYEDAVSGLHILNGIAIDRDDNLYVLMAANRVLDGKPYPNEYSGTVIKFKPGFAKIFSSSGDAQAPLGESQPKRAPDLKNGKVGEAWVDGAEWFYGGVGYDGFNTGEYGGGCACWNSRFSLDLYARSVAPETDHHSVALLDSQGNLMLRIGQYGNVDSSGAESKVPLGGDEVGLMYPCFTASQTDRRIFIADAGNSRIVSVKLDYQVSESLAIAAKTTPTKEK